MKGYFWILVLDVVALPGYPFVVILRQFKRMGDGTDNESSIIEPMIWQTIFGIIVWALIIIGFLLVSGHIYIGFK